MSIAAVVLAAGGGRRFVGTSHKLLAPYRSRPLVVSVLEAALSAGLSETAVVTGAVDLSELCPPGIVRIDNPAWESGLSSSLQAALTWASARGHEAVVIGLGDSPGVPASAWRKVADSGAIVAVASFNGGQRPPVRLAKAVWGEVPTEGDVGARQLWHREGTVVVECEGDPLDIDTTEDLARLEAGVTPPGSGP